MPVLVPFDRLLRVNSLITGNRHNRYTRFHFVREVPHCAELSYSVPPGRKAVAEMTGEGDTGCNTHTEMPNPMQFVRSTLAEMGDPAVLRCSTAAETADLLLHGVSSLAEMPCTSAHRYWSVAEMDNRTQPRRSAGAEMSNRGDSGWFAVCVKVKL